MTDITFNGVPMKQPGETTKRLSILVWGKAGSGKTTLATTMPGKKMWINFDPDGTDSIPKRDDVLIFDFSDRTPANLMSMFQKDQDALERLIKEHNIDSVIIDSVTAFAEKALEHSVMELASSKNRISITAPGQAGYAAANAYTKVMTNKINQACNRLNKHFMLICHEKEEMHEDDKGNSLPSTFSVYLGSALKQQIPLKLSEVWCLEDVGTTGSKKRLWIRANTTRNPMKTRMFKTTGSAFFDWAYDPDNMKGMLISDWFNAWVKASESGGMKIDLPKEK